MIRHLYLHIPFCHRICPYCNFYKHLSGKIDHGRFVQSLLMEIRQWKRQVEILPRTIYVGGGTPTALGSMPLKALLEGLQRELDLSELLEWTVEANPKTLGSAKANVLRTSGVNRISLGVQAWDPAVLKTLGRDHAPEEAIKTFREVRAAGFPSVSIDLMFSVPGLTAALWQASLEQTLALAPDHISAYNLTYEEDTEFLAQFRAKQFQQTEDDNADQFAMGDSLLTAAGYEHYEISNYARPGHRSLHNQSYWLGADYVGIGPGAVSTVAGLRTTNLRDTPGYMERLEAAGSVIEDREALSAQALRTERVALELRTAQGLRLEWLRDLPDLEAKLGQLQSEGYVASRLEKKGSSAQEGRPRVLQLSPSGLALTDEIAAFLLPDN